MKTVTVVSIAISLCLSGAAQSRVQFDPIVPKLSHRKYIVLDNTNHALSPRSLVEIPGVDFAKQFVAAEGTTLDQGPIAIPGVEVAKQFVIKEFGYVDGTDFVVKDTYTSDNGVTHTYLKQLYNGIEVVNGDLNINVDKGGNVISYGNSFYNSKNTPQSSPLSDNFGNSVDAFDALFKHIKVDYGVEKSEIVVNMGRSADEPTILKNITNVPNDVKAKKKYIQTSTGQLEPVWNLEANLGENWVNGFVTSSSKVVGLHDWVHQASYKVIPFNVKDAGAGDPQVITHQDSETSSLTRWHDQGDDNKFTATMGNNVVAYDARKNPIDWTKDLRAQGGKDLNFDFDFPTDSYYDPNKYVKASVTNLFYMSNMLHDIYYAHGFDEKAGNFQQNNFDKGGKGGDSVRAEAQNPKLFNQGYFGCPPDGEQPYLQLGIWNKGNGNRDSAFDNEMIIHEYTHGLSTRLTGGPSNVECLNTPHASGMGEGWGDTMAYVLRTQADYNRNFEFGFANYLNNGNTIRQKPYTSNKDKNSETYASINSYHEAHFIGAVWAQILYEVYWNLIHEAKFSTDLLSGDYKHGNTLFIRLLIDGMKLQVCNPTFIEARDAIIQAEENLTNDIKFKCAIWKGFAERGLGKDASLIEEKDVNGNIIKSTAVNGYAFPNECKTI